MVLLTIELLLMKVGPWIWGNSSESVLWQQHATESANQACCTTNKHQLSVNFHLSPQQNNKSYCIQILAIESVDVNVIIAVLIVLVIIR